MLTNFRPIQQDERGAMTTASDEVDERIERGDLTAALATLPPGDGVRRGLLLALLGDLDGAGQSWASADGDEAARYRTWLDSEPIRAHRAALSEAITSAERGEWAAARVQSATALGVHRQSVRALLVAGLCDEALGDRPAARSKWREAVQVDTANPTALRYLDQCPELPTAAPTVDRAPQPTSSTGNGWRWVAAARVERPPPPPTRPAPGGRGPAAARAGRPLGSVGLNLRERGSAPTASSATVAAVATSPVSMSPVAPPTAAPVPEPTASPVAVESLTESPTPLGLRRQAALLAYRTGRRAVRRRDRDGAVAALRQAAVWARGTDLADDAGYALAGALERTGQLDLSAAALDEVIQLGPTVPLWDEAVQRRVLLHRAAGESGRADSLVAELRRLDPKSPYLNPLERTRR